MDKKDFYGCLSLLMYVGAFIAVAVIGILITKVIVNSDLPLWFKIFLLR